jgi:nitric oxide reductase subunit B
MKYRSQKIAYWFFASCMLLLSLQLIYGFIMGFAHMGFDNLHSIIPFNTARATHTNLLVMWLLTGFMGAAYYIIPEEAEREIKIWFKPEEIISYRQLNEEILYDVNLDGILE